MKSFGLDIGSRNIKLAQLHKEGDKFKIEAVGLCPTPKSIETESKPDLIKIAESIKKLVKTSKIKTQNVVMALPEDEVTTRIIDFPPMSKSEIDSAIEYEAQPYLPISPSEAVYDYQIITTGEKLSSKKKTQVFLVASPKRIVEKYTSLAEMAGLKPVAVETEMIALSRSLISPGSGPTLIIDLGARATDIALIDEGQIVLSRSLPSAGEAITRSLIKTLGLKKSQAEAYKKAYGVDESKLEGKIKQAVGPILNMIVIEIEKAISFYRDQKKDIEVQRIILAGGTADLPQIVTLFAQQLKMEVEVGNPFGRLVNEEEIVPKIEKGTLCLYSIALGLAMREM